MPRASPRTLGAPCVSEAHKPANPDHETERYRNDH